MNKLIEQLLEAGDQSSKKLAVILINSHPKFKKRQIKLESDDGNWIMITRSHYSFMITSDRVYLWFQETLINIEEDETK